jgi:hypothetical protein
MKAKHGCSFGLQHTSIDMLVYCSRGLKDVRQDLEHDPDPLPRYIQHTALPHYACTSHSV